MIKNGTWGAFSFANQPLIIAGPCSAESEEQVLETARRMQKERISLFRAGIWKPRTRPGGFEGVGSVGLPWLQRVKAETGLPVTIEVATAKHVEEALKAGIDVLWIGARTTVNPFSVQEIADALSGVNIPVLVKNPVNPDAALWLGAIERLEQAGITQIGGIHRGVSQFVKTIYRNKPEWEMAFEFRKARPDLLLICDPSHITGNRELIWKVSQTALDLKFDGLMIETHRDPDNAWSDAAQQVTPEQLEMILNRLIIRSEKPANDMEIKNIEELRKSISYVDEQIIDLLSYRMKVVSDIAEFKKRYNMTIFQETRWNELLANHIEKGREKGLSDAFIAELFNTIHQASIDIQTQLINTK